MKTISAPFFNFPYGSVSRQFILKLFCLILFVIISGNSHANELLKDVLFKDRGSAVEITVKLAVPFSYVKHFPSKRGKIIQLQIGVDKKKNKDVKLKTKEILRPPEDSLISVRDVIYEGNVRGGPYLVLRFHDIVSFSIDRVKDSKSIKILIKKEKKLTSKFKRPAVSRKDAEAQSKIDKMMKDARTALTRGNNGEAIILFTQLLELEGHDYLPDAKEYLGLSRERNGQLEMAKKEYEEYLKLYPKNKRFKTVQQRLMTLNARISAPKRQLKESKRTRALKKQQALERVDIFGRFSQTYYTAYVMNDSAEDGFQQNSLLTFGDATWRKRDKDKEVRLVFNGSHELNLEADDDDPRDEYGKYKEWRIRSMYGEYKGKQNGFEFSFGRQSVKGGGVLGRIDGFLLGSRIVPKVRAYLVGGFPVDFSDHQKLETEKPLVGTRLDFDNIAKHWQGSTYAIYQKINVTGFKGITIDGITNRAAIGADARYFNKGTVFYSLLDYDVSYNELNYATVHIGWEWGKNTKFDFHIDRRKSPVMVTSNALQGISSLISDTDLCKKSDGTEYTALDLTTVTDLREKCNLSEDQIRERAKEYTGKSTLITTSARHSITKTMDLNVNLTVSKFEQSPALQTAQDDKEIEDRKKNRIPKETSFTPGKDLDKTLNFLLIQRDFIKPRDVINGGIRLSENKGSIRYEANATFRYPYSVKWWFNLRARYLYSIKRGGEEGVTNKHSQRYEPKFRVEYRYSKKVTIESEIGTSINKSEITGEDYTWTSGNFGFRYLF